MWFTLLSISADLDRVDGNITVRCNFSKHFQLPIELLRRARRQWEGFTGIGSETRQLPSDQSRFRTSLTPMTS
jgi:hypothetical protein